MTVTVTENTSSNRNEFSYWFVLTIGFDMRDNARFKI